MKKYTKYIAAVVVIIVIGLLAAPIVSANSWKSSTLDVVNAAIEAINKSSASVKEFDAKQDTTATDFDVLIAAHKAEIAAIETASNKAKNVGGFSGIDITGDYKKAGETSDRLVGIYQEILDFNKTELARTEAEKSVVVAIQSSGSSDDANGLRAQATVIQTANEEYQKYLTTRAATDVERSLSAVLTRLVDALNTAAQAIDSGDLGQLNAADAKLQSVLTELDAVDAQAATQTAENQKKIEAIVERLNAVAKELQ